MEFGELGAVGVCLFVIWKIVEKVIAMKKAGPASAVSNGEIKGAIDAHDKWDRHETDELKKLLITILDRQRHIGDKIDLLDFVVSEMDTNKLRLVWRNDAKDEKDHATLATILEVLEETNKTMAILNERTRNERS